MSEKTETDPILSLTFYTGGVILSKKRDDGIRVEYPVDPRDLQEAIGDISNRTPVLPENALCYSESLSRVSCAWWRPPGIETIMVEVDEKVNSWTVPLPGLVVICNGFALGVVAVKGDSRPTKDSKVYRTPLPNTYNDFMGKVCMGSARLPRNVTADSFEAVWKTYVRSTFNSHVAVNKCVSYPDDVRFLLLKLHEDKAKAFPGNELISTRGIRLEALLERWMD